MVGRARVVSDRTSVGLARIAPGLLVFVAATVLVTTHRFDGLYGQDAFGYVNYALGPLRDAFLHGEAIPSFQQPPGFPVVIAAISLVAGPDGRIGLVVSLLAGALVPVMTGLLASEAIGRRVGGGRAVVAVPIAAAVVAALPGQLWQSSAVAMSDTLSVALATTGAWAACRYGRTGRTRWLLLAAATVAAAIDTRWVSGLVAVPIAAVALLGVRTVWRADRRRAIRDAGAAALVGAIVLAPVAVPMGLAVAGGTTVPFAADFGAYAWDPLNALRTSFTTSDGSLTYATTSGAFYLGQAVAPYWFGPPGLLAIWGAVWVARRGGLAASILLDRLAGHRAGLPRRVSVPEHAVLPRGDAARRDPRGARDLAARPDRRRLAATRPAGTPGGPARGRGRRLGPRRGRRGGTVHRELHRPSDRRPRGDPAPRGARSRPAPG